MTDWHRLFGLILMDYFTGSCFEVELEKDLSQKRQLLDVVILRRTEGAIPAVLPDGLEDLADHNLLTYKSHHETLSDWSLKELTGHYVNYRKQVSPDFNNLLPEEHFRLYAVSARHPDKLAGQLTLQERQPGIYDVECGTDTIRLIVLSKVPQEERNAPLHLFSAVPQMVQFGAAHFDKHLPDTSRFINVLFDHYEIEGIDMPYTIEDFRRDYAEHVKQKIQRQVQKQIQMLTAEERLEGLPPEERLKGLLPEEILRSLPEDVMRELRRQIQQKDDRKSNGDANDD